jgi:haloalkane dehalogenase
VSLSDGLYPFADRFLDLGGVRLHYLDEGPGAGERGGRAVVLLHGNPTWSFYFRDLVRALSPAQRVIVPDHVGCGRSDKPPDARYAYRLVRRVADLGALLEHLGLERVALGVHDWGGMIGLAWAVEHRERLERLLVLNSAAFPRPAGQPIPSQLVLARMPLVGSLLVRGSNTFLRGAMQRCVVRPLREPVARGYLEPYRSWRDRIALLRFVQDIPLGPGHPSWQQLQATAARLETLRGVPILLCWGMRDFVFGESYLEQWLRRFPHAEVRRFADAGHWVLEDAGAEIATLARGFFDRWRISTSPPT